MHLLVTQSVVISRCKCSISGAPVGSKSRQDYNGESGIMALRDAAIVGYAETKIVEKSDRDIWEIGAEILAKLLDRTGFEKGEIDGLILSSSMTGASNAFWSQTTADQLGLELDFCQTVDIGGSSPTGALARAAAAIDAGLATSVFCLYADTQVAENNSRQRSFHGEWAAPLGYLGPPAAFGLLSKRYEHQFGLDYKALGSLLSRSASMRC